MDPNQPTKKLKNLDPTRPNTTKPNPWTTLLARDKLPPPHDYDAEAVRCLQIFDAVIVLTSFGLDLVFVEGITAAQSESAIALLIIFLLWRILRIVNGIIYSSDSSRQNDPRASINRSINHAFFEWSS